jgi:RNA polymerase sigma-70 factor (ECF subfamily)
LCQTYWYPIYAHVRQQGEDPDRAQDLTQGFFTYLLESKSLRVANPDRGRFRSFLKTAVRHYLSHEWRRERTQKRGGGRVVFSLDHAEAESRYDLEPADEETPESVFEERWARALLSEVFKRLRGEMREGTGQYRFRRLEGFLTGNPSRTPYKQVAAELEMSESAVKVTLHRMRQRFGRLLREEVARTVNDPGEVDAEIRYLFQVLGS